MEGAADVAFIFSPSCHRHRQLRPGQALSSSLVPGSGVRLEGREPRGAAAPLRLQRARGQEEEPRRPEGVSPPPPQGQNWNAWGNEVLSVLVKTVKRLQECDVLCLWREPSSLPWSVGAGKAAAAAEQEKGLRLPAGLRPGRATVPGREERPGRA